MQPLNYNQMCKGQMSTALDDVKQKISIRCMIPVVFYANYGRVGT